MYIRSATMDVQIELDGLTFEWDSRKAAANLRKHQVSFEQACEVFFDPFVRIVDAGPHAEAREAAVGLTEDWRTLFVVHVVRQGEIIRIVSAREATKAERRRYEDE